MAPGARSKFDAHMFEPEVFQKQMYCVEESTCDIVGTFRHSRSDSTSGALCPLVTPLDVSLRGGSGGEVCTEQKKTDNFCELDLKTFFDPTGCISPWCKRDCMFVATQIDGRDGL